MSRSISMVVRAIFWNVLILIIMCSDKNIIIKNKEIIVASREVRCFSTYSIETSTLTVKRTLICFRRNLGARPKGRILILCSAVKV